MSRYQVPRYRVQTEEFALQSSTCFDIIPSQHPVMRPDAPWKNYRVEKIKELDTNLSDISTSCFVSYCLQSIPTKMKEKKKKDASDGDRFMDSCRPAPLRGTLRPKWRILRYETGQQSTEKLSSVK